MDDFIETHIPIYIIHNSVRSMILLSNRCYRYVWCIQFMWFCWLQYFVLLFLLLLCCLVWLFCFVLVRIITVHGRTKEQKGRAVASCDWEAIRRIKEALPVPVFSNGGISSLEDLDR